MTQLDQRALGASALWLGCAGLGAVAALALMALRHTIRRRSQAAGSP